MKNLNMVIVEGNLVRDPKISQSKKGNNVLKFSIASNGYGTPSYYNGEKKEVSYLDIVCWGDLADNMEKSLNKGIKVTVYGNLSQWRWKDDENQSHNKISIMANHIVISKSIRKKQNVPF